MNNADKTMETIVALCKSRGFVYPGIGYLRRPGQFLGLRPSGRGIQKQRKKGLVEEIRPGMPL